MDDDRGEGLGDGLEDVWRLRTRLVGSTGGNPGHDGAAQPLQEPRDDLGTFTYDIRTEPKGKQ